MYIKVAAAGSETTDGAAPVWAAATPRPARPSPASFGSSYGRAGGQTRLAGRGALSAGQRTARRGQWREFKFQFRAEGSKLIRLGSGTAPGSQLAGPFERPAW
jgi:hypothetical protein